MQNTDTYKTEELDYEKLGLKCGLEIHQQLDSHKLFCNCLSEMREETPDATVTRILRASSGEEGEIDIAAKHEMEKRKHFIYEYYNDTTCLVELDEAPPFPINQDALATVYQICKMMNAEFVDQIHVMRKTVVDGSNTGGFQRTALIARNGFIDVDINNAESSPKILKVKIETVCIEEDSARIISKTSDVDTYRLDRLGVPLVEIATGPDMLTPKDAKIVAGYLGMILRSTGKVKRGLGTIRQDVNVSIAGGTRVEIKGVQELRMLDEVVRLEVLRQLSMLKLRERLSKIKLSISTVTDYTTQFAELSVQEKPGFITKGINSGQKIFGCSYKQFKGLFGFVVNPNRRFGSELSDRIKMFGLNGLIHTDENLEKYGISEIKNKIFRELDLDDNTDAMIFILGPEDKCLSAFKRINNFIHDFIDRGMSKEVRNAKDDGTSTFMRPMPGSSRMYPETDIPSFIVDAQHIKIPELTKDKIVRFQKEYLLPAQIAKELIEYEDFEYYVKKFSQIKPLLIAEAIDSMPKDIKTRYGKELSEFTIGKEQYEQIFSKLNTGEITRDSVFEILLGIAQGRQGKIIDFSSFQANEDDLVSYITKMIAEHPNLNESSIMGLVMKEYRGKFSGQKIMELIKKFKNA